MIQEREGEVASLAPAVRRHQDIRGGVSAGEPEQKATFQLSVLIVEHGPVVVLPLAKVRVVDGLSLKEHADTGLNTNGGHFGAG